MHGLRVQKALHKSRGDLHQFQLPRVRCEEAGDLDALLRGMAEMTDESPAMVRTLFICVMILLSSHSFCYIYSLDVASVGRRPFGGARRPGAVPPDRLQKVSGGFNIFDELPLRRDPPHVRVVGLLLVLRLPLAAGRPDLLQLLLPAASFRRQPPDTWLP